MPSTRSALQISELTIDEVNRVLGQINQALDELKGLRNEIVVHDTLNAKHAGFKVEDTNGTVIHGIGTFED